MITLKATIFMFIAALLFFFGTFLALKTYFDVWYNDLPMKAVLTRGLLCMADWMTALYFAIRSVTDD